MIHSYVNRYIKNEFFRFKYGDSHKIYTYMNVMYHDMLEDHDTDYWCCRNYVPYNKYYNLSGRATCMCCGKPIADAKHKSWYNDDSIDSYIKYCDDCHDEYSCNKCNCLSLSDIHYVIPISRLCSVKICEHCLYDEYSYDRNRKVFVEKHLLQSEDYETGRYKKLTKERVRELEFCGTIHKAQLPC